MICKFALLNAFFHLGAAGQNKQHLVTKNTAKLDRETEELHHERVPLEVGKVVQKGRQDIGMTQKDLATVSISHLIMLISFLTASPFAKAATGIEIDFFFSCTPEN